MTWWAEHARGQWFALAACLALVTAACAAEPAVTNAPAAAVSNALPAWMELDVLATNRAEWADLAETWHHPESDSSPVENLTLPIEHYDNGRIRAVLRANTASVGKAGLIWSWKVAVDLLDPAGGPDGRIEAESCLYDRNARRGYCPTAVSLIRTNVTIHGTGLYWVMTSQRMQILSNSVVLLKQGVKLPGLDTDKTNATAHSEAKLPQNSTSPAGGTPK